MKILIALFLLLASCGAAAAQGCGPQNPNCIVPTAPPGTSDNRAASTAFVQNATGGGGFRFRQTATPTNYYVNAGSAGNICSPNNLTTPQTCGAGNDSVTPKQASTVVAGVVAQPYATLSGALASIAAERGPGLHAAGYRPGAWCARYGLWRRDLQHAHTICRGRDLDSGRR